MNEYQIDPQSMGQNDASAALWSQMQDSMKFVGWMYIVLGALTCIGIITAVIGVPMIIAGLRAKDSSARIAEYLATGSDASYAAGLRDLRDHFKMLKIYFIIYLVIILLFILLYGTIFAAMFGMMTSQI